MIEKHRNPNGTYDGLGVLGDLSGLSRDSMHDIWNKVKENQKRLDGCVAHDFAPAETSTSRRRVCRVCGGEADTIAVTWYERGIRHASAA